MTPEDIKLNMLVQSRHGRTKRRIVKVDDFRVTLEAPDGSVAYAIPITALCDYWEVSE